MNKLLIGDFFYCYSIKHNNNTPKVKRTVGEQRWAPLTFSVSAKRLTAHVLDHSAMR